MGGWRKYQKIRKNSAATASLRNLSEMTFRAECSTQTHLKFTGSASPEQSPRSIFPEQVTAFPQIAVLERLQLLNSRSRVCARAKVCCEDG